MPRRSASKIIELFDEGRVRRRTLFFSRFKSVIAQIPTAQQIIPPVFEAQADGGAVGGLRIRAGRGEILAELLPRNIAVQMFRALLENAASEQGAQMRRWTTPRATPAT